MPRTANPWLRLWSEGLDSKKLSDLPPTFCKGWLQLLMLVNVSEPRGSLPNVTEIAFRLRLKLPAAESLIAGLIKAELVDPPDADGRMWMHKWDEWQRDSDVNLTPGRRDRHAVGTPLERATPAVGPPSDRIDSDRDKDKDKEEESEREQDARAPEHPFALAYATHYAQNNAGRPPAPAKHAEALALEREYGADACIQVATDLDWRKPPGYMRPILQERRDEPPLAPANGRKARPSAPLDPNDPRAQLTQRMRTRARQPEPEEP